MLKHNKLLAHAPSYSHFFHDRTLQMNYKIQVALTLHGFTLHDPHFTRGLYFCQMDSHYVMHYTISSLYTVKKHHLSIKDTVFYFTRISLYTIYLEKQKSCQVRATCICIHTYQHHKKMAIEFIIVFFK